MAGGREAPKGEELSTEFIKIVEQLRPLPNTNFIYQVAGYAYLTGLAGPDAPYAKATHYLTVRDTNESEMVNPNAELVWLLRRVLYKSGSSSVVESFFKIQNQGIWDFWYVVTSEDHAKRPSGRDRWDAPIPKFPQFKDGQKVYFVMKKPMTVEEDKFMVVEPTVSRGW